MSQIAGPEIAELLDRLRLLEQQRDDRDAGVAPELPPLLHELARLGPLTPLQEEFLTANRGLELALGPYLLVARVGAGGMGEIYEARDRRDGRRAALKVLRSETLAKPENRRRFQREILALSKLAHPNIVGSLGADLAGKRPYLAMEFVVGTDLGEWIERHGPMPVGDACEAIRQAARGLQHIHKQGLIHRDVKPSNLLLDESGTIKLLDLGLALLRNEPEVGTLTNAGAVLGTPDYIAPEQAHDARRVDIRSDLYALGCTLYYLLAGHPPFEGGSAVQKMFRHCFEDAPALDHERAGLPVGVVVVVRKLMAKQPGDRFQSPAELLAALDTLGPNLTGPAPVVSSGPPAVVKIRSRHTRVTLKSTGSDPSLRRVPTVPPMAGDGLWRWSLGLLTLTALAGVALLAGLLVRDPRKPPLSPVLSLSAQGAGPAEELALLRARAANRAADPEQLHKDLLAFRRRHRGTPLAREASALLRTVPGPLDRLDPKRQDLSAAGPRVPTGLVAILGESRQRHWGRIDSLAVSRDGRRLATGGDDGTVRIFATDSLRELLVLRSHPEPVTGVAFSSDGQRLLSATSDNERAIRIWDLATGKELRRIGGSGDGAVCGAFAPDGQHVLCGSYGEAALYDLTNGQPVLRLTAEMGWAHCVAVAPDGRTAVTVGDDRKLRLWDLATGHELRSFTGHALPVQHVVYSADGKQLLSCGGHTGRLWDVASGQQLQQFSLHPSGPTCGAFSPDGTQVLLAGGDGTISLFDAAKGRLLRRLTGHEAAVSGVAFAPDGERAYSASRDGTWRRWARSEGRELDPLGPAGPGRLVRFLADDRQLMLGHAGGGWLLLDPFGAPTPRRVAAAAEVLRLVVSADNKRLLTVGARTPPRLWDLAAAEPLRELEVKGAAEPISLALSSDGRRALTGGPKAEPALVLWDTDTGKPLRRLFGHDSAVTAVAISPDDRLGLSAAEDRTVRVWELATGRELRRIDGFSAAPQAVAFTPDGRTAIVVGGDRQVWLANLDTGRTRILTGHRAPAVCVSVSSDGQTLATATALGEVIVWRPATGEQLQSWRLPGPVHGLAFSSDGRFLATANGNGTVWLFRVPF